MKYRMFRFVISWIIPMVVLGYCKIAYAQTAVDAPQLNIPIPGLQFASLLLPKTGSISVPWLAQYIAAVAQFLLGASVTTAAIMIAYGGFRYIVGSTIDSVQKGKKIIADAVIGLILILGTYTILQTINPDLLQLNALKVSVIEPPDKAWIEAHGTGDVIASEPAREASANIPIPGTPSPSVAEVFAGEEVSIAEIPFDRSLGGPENINHYCTPASEAAKATTYEQKIQLLVKAVLGWEKVCVKNGLCAYVQGGSTAIPGGVVSGNPVPAFAMNTLSGFKVTGNDIWGSTSCSANWSIEKGAGSPSAFFFRHPECGEAAVKAYKDKVVASIQENKMYGGDCGATVFAMYACTGVKKRSIPLEQAYDGVQKKWVPTAYMSQKSLGKFEDDPSFVIGARLDADLNALAAPKGGFKFGDLIYVNGGSRTFAAHWFMYTGGRPDVPFSFIEMGGGGGVNVPGLGPLSGVYTHPAGQTIQENTTDRISIRKTCSPSGKTCWTTKPSYDAADGVIFVWRPFAD